MDVNGSMYDAQADTIDVDDIATNCNNRYVLRCIKRNNANDKKDLYIQNRNEYYDGKRCLNYVPEGSSDMGWLGYFVGKNNHLKRLYMRPFEPTSGLNIRDVMVPFFRGISHNKSIREIDFRDMNLLGGEVFTMLGSFFKDNHNLINIHISNCNFGDDGARLFALALGSIINKSLKKVSLENNNISEEGMVDIITSLSLQPYLQHLHLTGNRLHKNGCVALATLLRCSAKELQYLFIANNEINDEGIEALVPAFTNCNRLEILYLSNNPSITIRGWQSIASILESPNSNLHVLFITRNNVDDEAVVSFAKALRNNRTLQTLNTNGNPITAVGWQAFSKILCNTSSINATFLSNHSLWNMGSEVQENEIIGPLLGLNTRNNKKWVAMIKILQNHNDFDMQPFFEWEFKVLPLVLGWLERASACGMPQDLKRKIEPRKLSTIYQFVRGMPVLYVETRLRKELGDIKSEESQLEEEVLNSHQEYLQRKQLLQERKESIMEKLGGKLKQT